MSANPLDNEDGSPDWVVIGFIIVLILAAGGGLNSCLRDGSSVPPGERPCVEQMTNSC